MEIKCAITGKEFKTLRGFLNHLRTLKMSSKDYYDKFVKKEGEEICECGGLRKYDNWQYSKYCGQKCPINIENRLNAVRLRYIGLDREEKIKKFVSKRGIVDNNLNKRNETLRKKAESLGLTLHEYYSLHAKKGAASVTLEAKALATEKAMHTKAKNNNFGCKSCYKEYVLFGNTIKVQGYEPFILDYLSNILGPNELQAGGKNIECIKYMLNSKQKMYFPDAKMFDTIVEVKSTFTYENNKADVYAKIGGTFDLNKNIILVIPTIAEVRKNKLEGSKKLLDWAISSQASKDMQQPYVAIYDEGSTTILIGVESSDSKCRGSLRTLRECDIVWSSVKAEAA